MKYLKFFEDLNEPEVGDYVICQFPETSETALKMNRILKNEIGIIKSINKNRKYPYIIKFNIVDHEEKLFHIEDIIVYAKTIEELELKMNANKYNL